MAKMKQLLNLLKKLKKILSLLDQQLLKISYRMMLDKLLKISSQLVFKFGFLPEIKLRQLLILECLVNFSTIK